MSKSRLSINENSEIGFDNQSIRKTGVYIAMYGVAILFMIPYLHMLSTSLMPRNQIIAETPYLIPRDITLRWYSVLFDDTYIIEWIISTTVVAGGTTLVVMATSSMIAYALTRLEWRGKNVILSIIVASFMVPAIVNLVPLFTIVAELGLVNSYAGVILPLAATPLGVFLLVQFFKDIPDAIEEAAKLDGFSHFQIFSRIILPLMKPALSALGIFIFISTWNAFLWPLVILQREQMYTLPVGLVTLQDSFGQTDPGLIMASTIVASVPLLVVFLVLQKQIVNAVQMQGTVK